MKAPQTLLGARELSSPVAWRRGQPISAATLLADAQALAQRLPANGQAINLCQDRYRFSVGLLAALQRGQQSLLPPDALPTTLALLAPADGASYFLFDDPALDLTAHRSIEVLCADPEAEVDDMTAAPTASALRLIAAPPGDSVCLLTSGSTGQPQAQRKQWTQLQMNIAAQAQRLAALLAWPSVAGLNLVATVPPQHSYGFESSVLLALFGGAAFDVSRPFYPADIADTLARMPHPRGLVTTPFHLKTLLLSGVALPQVDLIMSATAPLSPQLAARAEAVLGGRLIEIYGCTEAGQVATRRTTAGEVWQTLGDLRITAQFGAELDVHPSDQSNGFSVLGGHVLTPTPLADVLELIDAQHFRLLGRASDIVHVAGKRSSLAHLDFHLNRIEGVVDGAFWLPDDVTEGVVRTVAFVVAPGLSPHHIISALRGQLEGAFVPRRVVFVDALPRAATGKLLADTWRAFVVQRLAARRP